MIFSSMQFILLFLPVVFVGYFSLNRMRLCHLAKLWLALASVFFYGYWNIAYIPLLLGSIAFNFFFGSRLARLTISPSTRYSSKWMLIFAVTVNLALLGYFKYENFFAENINWILNRHVSPATILLPLGISFFTFTQIAFLVDSYRGKAREYEFLNYALFVTFFPHLIAGPILHHSEMMPQFASRWTKVLRFRNICYGLFIFSIGFFKKSIIADNLAGWANFGFDDAAKLDFFGAWAASLSYTFQLYFDFSGYCDMAIGAALLFNIWLPINFNSPYKALDIQDFWRRWHITLSRYLRDYLYIPLGGNRRSGVRVYANVLVTFVLGGLWHGPSWMFVLWGAMHGGAVVAHRLWTQVGMRLPRFAAWFLTFMFVNTAWIFFRAKNWDRAVEVFRGMVDFASIWNLPVSSIPTNSLAWAGWLSDDSLRYFPTGLAAQLPCYFSLLVAGFIFSRRNSFELMIGPMSLPKLVSAAVLFCIALYSTIATASTVFLYYNF